MSTVPPLWKSFLVKLQGFFGKECANEALALEYNKPVSKAEALFEYDYYSLPQVAAAELQNTVEVKVQASFSSSDGYSDWVSARPELLLLKVSHIIGQIPNSVMKHVHYAFHDKTSCA